MINRHFLYAGLAGALVLSIGGQPMKAQAPTHPWQAPDHGAAPPHQPNLLHTSDLDGVFNKELRVFRTVYPPGAANTKHYHTSHVVFYILEGEGVWQEEGKAPVTLRPGDTLIAKPGTVHAHWNPSKTTPLVFSEVVIVDKNQRSTVRMP